MNIGILLRNPFQKLVEKIHNDLADAGYPEIRPAHGVVFQFIGKNGARLTDLAQKAQITKQSMSYLLDYLEKHGHVERSEDETDARAVKFRLTKKGWKVVDIAESSISAFETHCKKILGPAKYKEATSILSELNSKL